MMNVTLHLLQNSIIETAWVLDQQNCLQLLDMCFASLVISLVIIKGEGKVTLKWIEWKMEKKKKRKKGQSQRDS